MGRVPAFYRRRHGADNISMTTRTRQVQLISKIINIKNHRK